MALEENTTAPSTDLYIITKGGTTMYAGVCTLFLAARDDANFQIGQFTEARGPWMGMKSHRIAFDRPRSPVRRPAQGDPIWLNHVYIPKRQTWCIRPTTTNITTEGFVVNIVTGEGARLSSAGIASGAHKYR